MDGDAGPEARRILTLRERASDSPYVEAVWTSVAGGGPMTSVACARRELVFWSDGGVVHAALRGPETVPTTLDVPAGHAAFGIVLTHGTTVPGLAASSLVDDVVQFATTGPRRFAVNGEDCPVPRPGTAEDLVERLVRAGILARDPLVDDVLAGDVPRLGIRSVQRRVRAATGLTHGTVRQIERVRAAAVLLGAGVAPIEVVDRLGYHDHPHLARSLARFVGHTASALRAPRTALSLPPGRRAEAVASVHGSSTGRP